MFWIFWMVLDLFLCGCGFGGIYIRVGVIFVIVWGVIVFRLFLRMFLFGCCFWIDIIVVIGCINVDMVFIFIFEIFMFWRIVFVEMIFFKVNKIFFLFDENIFVGSRIGYYFVGVRGMVLFIVCISGFWVFCK